MTDEATTNIGQVCVGDEDDEANFYYVNVVNHYRIPAGGARKDHLGRRHFDELANHLKINSERVAGVVDVPITREDCLQLARMFLNAANHYSWDEMP